MNPLDAILKGIDNYDPHNQHPNSWKEAKAEIVALFKAQVPEEQKTYSNVEFTWNDCRSQMLDNLENLK